MLTGSSIEWVEELSDGGGYLQSSEQYSLLSLNLDISGPSDKSGLYYSGSDVVTESEVSGFSLG
jgi:hypothetical protein